MADRSHIEWTDATWNVITGCTRVSDGCDHCYIERTPPFRMAGRRFDGRQTGATTGVLVHPERLGLPLQWRKPRKVFVNSLSDLFHESVSDELIARVFAVMAHAYRHTFQILTKRHARMRSLVNSPEFLRLFDIEFCSIPDWNDSSPDLDWAPAGHVSHLADGPLSNVWLGVSVEDQHWADIRIPALLETPTAVRWISAEPLLGPVNLDPWRNPGDLPDPKVPADTRLDWVVVGGESGPRARPMHPQWARDLRDQCAAAGVPFLFKQWGQWLPLNDKPGAVEVEYVPVGKKAAGRELDGRTHDGYPATTVTR